MKKTEGPVYCNRCRWMKKPLGAILLVIPIPEFNFVCSHPKKRESYWDAYNHKSYKPRLMDANPRNDCTYYERRK